MTSPESGQVRWRPKRGWADGRAARSRLGHTNYVGAAKMATHCGIFSAALLSHLWRRLSLANSPWAWGSFWGLSLLWMCYLMAIHSLPSTNTKRNSRSNTNSNTNTTRTKTTRRVHFRFWHFSIFVCLTFLPARPLLYYTELSWAVLGCFGCFLYFCIFSGVN